MIRRAAAYATAASIGTVVGTLVGCLGGIALMAVANSKNVQNKLNAHDDSSERKAQQKMEENVQSNA